MTIGSSGRCSRDLSSIGIIIVGPMKLMHRDFVVRVRQGRKVVVELTLSHFEGGMGEQSRASRPKISCENTIDRVSHKEIVAEAFPFTGSTSKRFSKPRVPVKQAKYQVETAFIPPSVIIEGSLVGQIETLKYVGCLRCHQVPRFGSGQVYAGQAIGRGHGLLRTYMGIGVERIRNYKFDAYSSPI